MPKTVVMLDLVDDAASTAPLSPQVTITHPTFSPAAVLSLALALALALALVPRLAQTHKHQKIYDVSTTSISTTYCTIAEPATIYS